jgi:hypothetical protein
MRRGRGKEREEKDRSTPRVDVDSEMRRSTKKKTTKKEEEKIDLSLSNPLLSVYRKRDKNETKKSKSKKDATSRINQ